MGICFRLIFVADTRRLEPCNEALFVDERPNLFIDDMFNVENAVSSINSSDTASPPVTAKQSTLVLCRAFSDALIHHKKVNNSNSTECEDEDDLLDLPSKPEWYGAARRLQLACQAVNIETPREVLRMLY